MKTGNFPLIKFQEIKRLNPYWSDYICFAETIKNKKNLSRKTTKKYFGKLVNKNDYAESEKNQVLQHLIDLGGDTRKTVLGYE